MLSLQLNKGCDKPTPGADQQSTPPLPRLEILARPKSPTVRSSLHRHFKASDSKDLKTTKPRESLKTGQGQADLMDTPT